jgi:hypothetical protein
MTVGVLIKFAAFKLRKHQEPNNRHGDAKAAEHLYDATLLPIPRPGYLIQIKLDGDLWVYSNCG